MAHSHENKNVTETGSEEAQTLYLLDKTFKSDILNKRLTKTMGKEIKEARKTMH